jgi:hypothetical protein
MTVSLWSDSVGIGTCFIRGDKTMKRRFRPVSATLMATAVAFGTLALTIPAPAAQAQATGQWQLTGSLATAHSNTHLAQLPDGRVLAISGSPDAGALTPAAEIYDPGTGQWAPAGTLNNARVAFGQPSVLANGDVLVAGGTDVNVNDYASAELYDPATSQWALTGSLNTARRYPVQVALGNGEALIATGSSGPPTCTRYLSSAELYDPATGQWTYTGSTLVPRESAMAIRLADGRALLAGGYNGGGSACTDTDPVDTETYDPATGQWSFAGNLPHGWLGGAMVLLPDHRVLMADGWQHGSSNFAEAVIFDPSTNQWSEAAPPALPRSGAAATLLPDGKVLVSGGGQLQSEIYDPATNAWSLDATTLDGINGGQTVLLPDGQVLLADSTNSTGASTTAELYTPPSQGSQAISFTGPGSGVYGGSATLTATGGGSGNPVVFSVDSSSATGACTVSGTNGSTVTYTGTGTCVIDADEVGGNGYSPAPQVQQSIAISPAPLTISASSSTMTFGGQPPVIAPSYSGFVAGDGAGSLTTQPTCSTAAASTSPLGSSQPSACSGAADPDYRISYVSGTVTVVLGNYVAMGDSYSSGEGNGSYTLDGNTNTSADMCHRSLNSYPEDLFTVLPYSTGSFTDVACSGAETHDFIYPNAQNHEAAQISAAGLGNSTNVVTFTIGGDDAGFGEALKGCVHFLLVQGYGCSKNTRLLGQVAARIAALQGLASANTPQGYPIISIPALLQQIHQDAPHASIFVGGYPHLFGSSTQYFQADVTRPGKYVCGVAIPPLNLAATIDYADAQWINSETDALDNAIAAAVSQAQAHGIPVTYVGAVPGVFQTHGLCDSGTLWFHPASWNILAWMPDKSSFHPTTVGQQQGYEVAFASQ